MKDNQECKFCGELFNGDCNDSIMSGTINKFEVFNGYDIFVDLFITDNELELYLDDSGENEILKKKIKINYCPICGRRLGF